MIAEILLLCMIAPFVLLVVWLYDVRTREDLLLLVAFVAVMAALYVFMVVIWNA